MTDDNRAGLAKWTRILSSPRRANYLKVASTAMLFFGQSGAGCTALVAVALMSSVAHAELKLCNATTSRVGVAIGYQDARGWATEGWWNVGAQSCEFLLRGPTPSRYVYVYAVDYERGGEWSGKHNMCIANSSFVIRDMNDCESRGYRTGKFYEVDTGNASSWTIRLSEPKESEQETN
ncbi:MAG: DUF1036 domain-containing protein [Hyphomicrobiaceae bacterium]